MIYHRGIASSTRLKQLLPVGQGITLRAIETDKYKRLVAEVFVENLSVNLNMVQEGQAVVYRQYLKGCPQSKDSLLQGENTAKQQRLAFWSQANRVMPWDFRHRATQKTTSQAIQPQQQNNCDPSYPDFCIPKNSPDLNPTFRTPNCHKGKLRREKSQVRNKIDIISQKRDLSNHES
ncbi:thermonuclease family protein [Nostoc sp. C117]|uniref:thermonuclease family protein n=1 Tax=Nostoc sp. C117 TaxID=3349875 RepID=UPI00370D4454